MSLFDLGAILWLTALPAATDDPHFVRNTRCLAEAVYHEARGESLEGQAAVAEVVMNRVADERWGDDPCEVVYEEAQFSWTQHNPKIKDQKAFQQATVISAVVYMEMTFEDYQTDEDPLLYFYNPDKANPGWAKKMKRVAQIGEHVFLTDR